MPFFKTRPFCTFTMSGVSDNHTCTSLFRSGLNPWQLALHWAPCPSCHLLRTMLRSFGWQLSAVPEAGESMCVIVPLDHGWLVAYHAWISSAVRRSESKGARTAHVESWHWNLDCAKKKKWTNIILFPLFFFHRHTHVNFLKAHFPHIAIFSWDHIKLLPKWGRDTANLDHMLHSLHLDTAAPALPCVYNLETSIQLFATKTSSHLATSISGVVSVSDKPSPKHCLSLLSLCLLTVTAAIWWWCQCIWLLRQKLVNRGTCWHSCVSIM